MEEFLKLTIICCLYIYYVYCRAISIFRYLRHSYPEIELKFKSILQLFITLLVDYNEVLVVCFDDALYIANLSI